MSISSSKTDKQQFCIIATFNLKLRNIISNTIDLFCP